MELNKEIIELEKQMEAIDKSKNPIEKNPENKRNKGTTLDMENIPKDKECSDKTEDKEDKYVKMKKELFSTIETFNSLSEAKIFIDDIDDAPPGSNVQVGPRGGYYYDTGVTPKKTGGKKDDKIAKAVTSDKDLAKTK